jgi:GNAT superfamily N-acetyltransferase
MDVRIRAADPGDAESIALLSGDLGYPSDVASTRERLLGILADEDQRLVVAVDPAGAVCGWLQARCNVALESGLRVEIVGLIVSDAMRRRGVGRSLVAQAETWATKISAETIVVRSNTKRVESHAFYTSLGYLASKTQVVYRKKANI